MTTILDNFQAILEKFATDLTAKYSFHASFNPEDQLKSPVASLFGEAGKLLKLNVETVTEVQIAELAGRPDIGVSVQSLVAGYVELKAPGKGANPVKLKGADKKQWEKFQNLPNLIYTDGNEWGLYRNGSRTGKLVRLSGDVTTDGTSAIGADDAKSLFDLLRDFLRWEPIVPATPRALAELLAPICRLLREDVLTALQNPNSNLSALAVDWRKYLFPDADDKQFADAYAQTLTYALLLARLSGAGDLSLTKAVKTIRIGHRLLSDTLKILGDEAAREEINVPVSLLERVIAAVDAPTLIKKSKGDPWLYFYEDFLAVYDPQMRKDRGVYYTPVPVVQTQVRLVAELLAEKFETDFSFVDSKVITLDPAAGTGTYALAAIEHGLEQVATLKGAGMRAKYASTIAQNMHAFEILVGPYAVAHLRLTQQILSEGGQVPDDGVHVYLTDTLESPHAKPPQLPLLYKPLGEEHQRAQKVKAETPVLVCIGNPPYDRQQLADESQEKRKGGWIRFGDIGTEDDAPLRSFLDPLTESGLGVHAKNLYNDYIYFWRWALWKVFESKSGPGIVSFITASSYLRGPGFAGVRQVMRQTFDDLWIIDLEGDNLGARKSDNVFAIQTPVAIAVGVRYNAPHPDTPANVHYTRLDGTEKEKLARLENVTSFQDFQWRECLTGWHNLFLPDGEGAYWDWPLLTDLFPWQENGMQFKRTWPIGESRAVLETRWAELLKLSEKEQGKALKETGARKITKSYPALDGKNTTLPPIAKLTPGTSPFQLTRYAYRSFDRHWVLKDNRLCDRPRPTLQSAHSDKQVYLTSFITNVLGEGSAAVATALIPDLDHFRGSFGAKHVIPLWRDVAATDANLTVGVLGILGQTYNQPVTAEDFFAYCYALLATPQYVKQFWDELTIPGPRLPITKNAALFEQAAALGRRLLWLHTYAERFVPPGHKPGKLPPGQARCKIGTSAAPAEYPEDFGYNYADQELWVGKGVFEKVRTQVWEFSVSGLEVVKSWLGYRMRKRSGKSSSPLDNIRPQVWEFDEELLDLLWVLDHTVDLLPEVTKAFEAVLAGELFKESDFQKPTETERKGPKGIAFDMPLFDFAGIDTDDSEDEED
jgi:hypothetical protein